MCIHMASNTRSIALVDVESFVEELSKESPRLRHAERVRALPVDRQVGSVAERGRRITNRGEAHARDERSGRAVGHAIVPSRLESRLEAQLGEIVGPDDETPALAWNHFALVPEAIANREDIRRVLTVRGGIDHRRTARGIVDEKHLGHLLVVHDLDAEPIVRPGRQPCRRRVDPEQRGGDVDLPSDPHQRVAVAHQQAVAEIGVGGRIVAWRGPIEPSQQRSTATVRDLEQQNAVALRRIRRAKHIEVGREAHAAIRITWRVIQIDDAGVVRIGRIQRELDPADEPFVRPAWFRRTARLPRCVRDVTVTLVTSANVEHG